MSLGEAAATTNVPRSTLRYRRAGRESRAISAAKRTLLTSSEENALIAYIGRLYNMGIPCQLQMSRRMADHILRQRNSIFVEQAIEYLRVGVN